MGAAWTMLSSSAMLRGELGVRGRSSSALVVAPADKSSELANVREVEASTVGYRSVGPIENNIMFLVTSACARRTGTAARVERRRRER